MTASLTGNSRTIFVVSDSTGGSAEQITHAALVQFDGELPPIQVCPRIRTAEDLDTILEQASKVPSLVIHTLVHPGLVEHLVERATELGIECHDLMNPLLGKLSVFLDQAPRNRPGRSVALDQAYFRRIEALEFTVNADDGRGIHRLAAADIVLVGLSRTSKTPVATYLAGQGYKVANVPLVRQIPLPEALGELERGKVFALTIDPEKLTDIRSARMSQLGAPKDGEYADYDHVADEVRWARDLFRQWRWPVIDVTNQAIEETASLILRLRSKYLATTP